MNKSRALQLIAFAAFSILAFSVTYSEPSVATERSIRPNILFIAIDDLDTSVGAYGGPAITPNIDSIAAEGVRFDAAFTDAVLCNPSRTSMVTGLRPTSIGIYHNVLSQQAWRDFLAQPGSVAFENYGPDIGQITTLFQHFAANGYYVANSGKTFHNNTQQNAEPWDRNFSWPSWNSNGWPANAPLHGMDYYFEETLTDWGAVEDGLRPDDSGTYYTENDIPEYRIANNAITILEEMPHDEPFLVSVGFVLPHNPRYVPQRLLDLYPPESMSVPVTLASDLEDIPPTPISLISQGGEWLDQTYIFDNPQQWRSALAAYYASATYVDEQIGRILSTLDQTGLADDTVVVIWSDHGYHLGQKQHLQKNTLWQESARIPLIIRAPGLAANAATSAPVNSVDLFPTLVDLAGLSMPTDFPRDGRSLVPLLNDPAAPWPWPGTTFLANYAEGTLSRGAIRTPEWGYIGYGLDLPDETREEELYDYTADPLEWVNLLAPINGDPTAYYPIRSTLHALLQGQTQPDAPPVANPAAYALTSFEPFAIELTGQDGNLDPLLYTITTLPTAGWLYQSADGQALGERIVSADTVVQATWNQPAYVLYVPRQVGGDTFRFAVTDGRTASSATITLTIEAPHASYLPIMTE